MAVLDTAIEPRDYDKYLNTYGKEGESDFIKYITPHNNRKNYSLFDVTGIKEYQYISVDYVISKLNLDILPGIETVVKDDNFIKIEVKNSFTALKTGHMAYELTTSTKLNDNNRKYYNKKVDKNGELLKYSYDCVGWCLKTKANLIYHTFTNKDTHEIEKRAWIYMDKWHEFVKNPLNQLMTNIILDERVVDILCPIKKMEEQKVLQFIN